jgi:hypothetical protein
MERKLTLTLDDIEKELNQIIGRIQARQLAKHIMGRRVPKNLQITFDNMKYLTLSNEYKNITGLEYPYNINGTYKDKKKQREADKKYRLEQEEKEKQLELKRQQKKPNDDYDFSKKKKVCILLGIE